VEILVDSVVVLQVVHLEVVGVLEEVLVVQEEGK